MSKITFTDDAGNAQDVALPDGIALTVAPPALASPMPPVVTPNVLFNITQSGNACAAWDKTAGLPAGTKGTIDWGDGKTPGAITVGGSSGRTLANGTYSVTVTYGAYSKTLPITVPKVAPPPSDPPPITDPVPVSPPPPPVSPPPPTTSSTSTDVPSVTADGQSILYHYPVDETLAAAVDHIEIPGTFGGSPETVAKIAWNFGDGTNGWGADGRHPYDKPGTYTITGSVNYRDGRIVPFGPLTVTVAA